MNFKTGGKQHVYGYNWPYESSTIDITENQEILNTPTCKTMSLIDNFNNLEFPWSSDDAISTVTHRTVLKNFYNFCF